MKFMSQQCQFLLHIAANASEFLEMVEITTTEYCRGLAFHSMAKLMPILKVRLNQIQISAVSIAANAL